MLWGRCPADGLFDDIPRSAFAPIAAVIQSAIGHRPNGGDSAEAIEHGFEDLWSDVRAAAAPKKMPEWDQPFLSLFYTDNGAYRSGMPLWFANGTDATTGNRVITAPILAPDQPDSKLPWPFRGARDFHTLMHDPHINRRRRVHCNRDQQHRGVGSLVDGGYFENEGLQTALDLAEWLADQSKTLGRPVQPIIVQATGDGEADVGSTDVMTCANASDGAFVPDDKHSSLQIFAPLIGLYHVRGGHSAVLLRRAHDYFCDPPRFVHFDLPADQEGHPLEKEAFSDRQVKNAAELTTLDAALAPGSP